MRLFIAVGPLPSGIEEHIAEACKGNHLLMAPELMLIEVANVLQRRTGLKEIDHLEGSEFRIRVLTLNGVDLIGVAWMELAKSGLVASISVFRNIS